MRTLTTILLLTLSNVIIAQTPEWLTIGGGAPSAESSGSDKGIHIVADEDGNSYITGYYNVEADFGPFNTGFSFPSSKEVFIAKIDDQGAYQWVVNGLNYYDDRGLGICLDTAGNVFVTGTCWGAIEFDGIGDPMAAGWTDQIFVVKVDNNGNVQWVKTAGNPDGTVSFGTNENGLPQTLYQDDHGQDLVADEAGNVFITGFLSNIDVLPHDAYFDAIAVPLVAEDSVSFLAKISNDGVWQWVETFDGEYKQRDPGIGIDDDDNVYVVGGYMGHSTIDTVNYSTTYSAVSIDTVFLDPPVNTQIGSIDTTWSRTEDIYVAKFDNDGNFLWVNWVPDSLDARADAVSFNGGHVYVTGEFRTEVYFGTDDLNNYGAPGDKDIFVAKVTKDGEWLWATKAGSTSGGDRGIGISANDQGNVFVCGQFRGDAAFGSIPVSAGMDSTQFFIGMIDSSGVWQWVRPGGGPYDKDRANSIASNGCDIYTIGYFRDTIGFETLGASPYNKNDIWVIKMSDACEGTNPPPPPPPAGPEEEMCTLVNSNVITLNGDQINDEVFFAQDCNIPVEINILNRWGEIVYQTNDPSIGWNGTTTSGQPVAEGVYFYRVRTMFSLKPNEEISGFIHVLRP